MNISEKTKKAIIVEACRRAGKANDPAHLKRIAPLGAAARWKKAKKLSTGK